MILTCPECATRYFVDDAKLGGEGRTVRCAGCGSRWHAKAEPDLELVATPDEGAVAVKAAEPAAEAPAAEPLPKVFRAKAVEKKSMRLAAVHGVVWAGLAATLCAVLAIAALFRVDIVRMIPRAAGAYAKVGLTVNPTGLVFEGVTAHPALQDGHSALVVSGSIRNIEDRTVTAPAVRINILDKGGHAVGGKVVATENPHLKPGEIRHFVVALIDPPASANNVEVAFAFNEAGAHVKGSHGPAPAEHVVTPAMRGPAEPDLTPVPAAPLAPDSPHALPAADHAPAEHAPAPAHDAHG